VFDLSEYIDFNGNSCQIYVLIDPRDHVVHYVGRCANPLFRYYQHLHVSPSQRVRRWINELQLLGLTPTMNVIETIHREANTSQDAFLAAVREREAYWILEYLCSGAPLLNTLGVPAHRLHQTTEPVTHIESQLVEDVPKKQTEVLSSDELLDVGKVAEELGVHVDTVRKWIREKQLRAVKLGRRGGYRIRRSNLDEFLRKRETIQDNENIS
jgi:excisionase family DNA binding protein